MSTSYGARYEDGMGLTTVAKRVRADVRALQVAKMLPSWKVSVRTSRFAGGQAIDATVTAPIDEFVAVADWDGTCAWKMSGPLVVVVRTIESLLADFQRTTTYGGFNRPLTAFYSNVSVEGWPPFEATMPEIEDTRLDDDGSGPT